MERALLPQGCVIKMTKCEHKYTILTPIKLLQFENGKVLYKYKEECQDCGKELPNTELKWFNGVVIDE